VGGSDARVSGAALRQRVASHSNKKRRASATPSRALTLAPPGGRAGGRAGGRVGGSDARVSGAALRQRLASHSMAGSCLDAPSSAC
jgi:hypothetical protein